MRAGPAPQLPQATKVHNRISGDIKAREVDDQLKRLLDMSLRGIITDEEYKEKKAQLLNRKFDISAKGDSNGDWLEHFRNFLSLAHQASYIAAGANHDAQRDFLQKIVSNLKLYNKTLIVSYTSAFKIHAETPREEMGSLSYFMRVNLSAFTGIYYKTGYDVIKKIRALERLFPRVI